MSEFKYVPSYLSAKTKDALVIKMAQKCALDGISYRFFDISFDITDKVWIAWYYPEKDSK